MSLQWLWDRFRDSPNADAIVWDDRPCSYDQLLARIDAARSYLRQHNVTTGDVLMLDADFSPNAVAMLLAAIDCDTIVVPVAAHVANIDRSQYARIAEAQFAIRVNADDTYDIDKLAHSVEHSLLRGLQDQRQPGLVLFSSGSTGAPKAAVHNLHTLLSRFREPRHRQRMITFLLFDHIGGFNTLMYTLANQGCAITLAARNPDAVCRAIAQHRAEVLPTSPTFLNLMLMGGAIERFDLSSLKVINYATEVMPAATLARLNERLPQVTFHQSYGLSEMGIMRTKSRSSDSLWLRLVGEGYETRVVDGVLLIKSETSMLGYLNAPSPFTDNGWFNTQDEVELDGEWFRFKGRQSDIINVGGEKVYPAEVESVILEVDNIDDVTVAKEPHPFTGNIVVAQVRPQQPEDIEALAKRIRQHCFARLPSYKVPVKVTLAEDEGITSRFKKRRQLDEPTTSN